MNRVEHHGVLSGEGRRTRTLVRTGSSTRSLGETLIGTKNANHAEPANNGTRSKSAPTPERSTEPRDAPRHPLGLPAGSVRALLTLLVVGFIVGQTIRGVPVKLLWTETLMIVLAHYFTSRRFVQLSPELRERLEAEGAIEADGNPLHLPRHSIRTLIIGGFVGLAVYLYREGRMFEDQSIAILGTVGAYLLGIVVRWLMPLFLGAERQPPNWWIDTKAMVTIVVVAGTVTIQWLGLGPQLPFSIGHLENFTMGVVLFYFGSR